MSNSSNSSVPGIPLLPQALLAPGCAGLGPSPAYRALYEDVLYRNRDVVADRTNPVFPQSNDPMESGQAGLVNLNSRLRPCFSREPAGSHQSLRNQPRPLGLILTPKHWETQLPDDLNRHKIFDRVEDSKCPRPNPCAMRKGENLFFQPRNHLQQVRSV
jgi:hypothetical protein